MYIIEHIYEKSYDGETVVEKADIIGYADSYEKAKEYYDKYNNPVEYDFVCFETLTVHGIRIREVNEIDINTNPFDSSYDKQIAKYAAYKATIPRYAIYARDTYCDALFGEEGNMTHVCDFVSRNPDGDYELSDIIQELIEHEWLNEDATEDEFDMIDDTHSDNDLTYIIDKMTDEVIAEVRRRKTL